MPSPTDLSTASLLAQYPVFQLFDARDLEAVAAQGETVRVGLGDRVFRRGESGRHIYLVLRGRLRISRTDPSGRRESLGRVSAGDLIGAELLVPPGRFHATCTAAEPTQLHRLPLERVHDLICRRPEIDFRLPGLLALHSLLFHCRNEKLQQAGPQDCQTLWSALRPQLFPAGAVLTSAGVKGSAWFLVRSGTVALGQGEGSREFGPGRSFGGEALLGLESREGCRAVTAVECLCLPASEFERLQPAAGSQSIMLSAGLEPSWVGQRGAADCGAAALTMAARRLGLRVPIEDVHKHLIAGERGSNMDNVARAAEALGLKAHATKAGEDAWPSLPLPAVALLTDEHYIVVYRWGPDVVVVGDPAQGIAAWQRTTFLRRWSGHLLLLELGPMPVPTEPENALAALRQLFDQARAGDPGARAALGRHFASQQERSARRMLRQFKAALPEQQRLAWLEVARQRLREVLAEAGPVTLRQAVVQAAEQTHQEVKRLAQVYLAALPQVSADAEAEPLRRWLAFHDAAEKLAAEDRELIGLYFYQGWAFTAIAALLDEDEAAVQCRWRTVCNCLAQRLDPQLPPS